MKKYYKNMLIISIVLYMFFCGKTFANTTNCEALSGYEKYMCQNTQHCEKYTPEKITYTPMSFPKKSDIREGEDMLETAQYIYRENQNGIYACSIMMIQKNTLNLIKQKLIKTDKTGTLSSKMQSKIELQLNKLTNLSKNKNCKHINKDSTYAKKEVLTESMYQLCNYSFYLEYMKEYYSDIANVLENSTRSLEVQSYDIMSIMREKNRIQEEILLESEHAQLVFELAFESYVGYESNLSIHLLLQLIQEDLIVYREKLHKAISPISQVVYKISNAMSVN